MQFDLHIQGIDELARMFRELPEDLDRRPILRDALKEGAEPIQAEAKRECPVYQGPPREAVTPGQLRDSIKIKSRTRKGGVTVKIETGEGDFKGDTFYGAFIEYGHHVGKRSGRGKLGDTRATVDPHPFMRPAFDTRKEEAAFRISEAITRSLGNLLAQYGLDASASVTP